MPIISAVPLQVIDQEEFAAIDYRVMGCAFDCHNEFGRLCDEVIYQQDMAARLVPAGLGPVRTNIPVTAVHRDFAKTYYLDLVVGDKAIYELKTASGLVSEHDAQLLNYLFLEGVSHGKLINFRPAQVQSRFVNTTLTPETRRQMTAETRHWKEGEEGSNILRLTIQALLEDWGWIPGAAALPGRTDPLPRGRSQGSPTGAFGARRGNIRNPAIPFAGGGRSISADSLGAR